MNYNTQAKFDLRISELIKDFNSEQLHDFILHEESDQTDDFSRHLRQRKEYLTFYSTYIQLSNECSLNTRISSDREAVVHTITEHFESGKKLLLTRWGDGEGMILPWIQHLLERYPLENFYNEKGSPEYMKPLIESAEWAWWRLWFGRKLMEESQEKLRMLAEDIHLAMSNSQIIGYWSPKPDELIQRGWSTFRRSFGILALNPVISNLHLESISCSASIQVQLLKSGVLENLIKKANRVLLVTGRHKVKNILSEKYGEKFDLMAIPTTNPKNLLSVTDPYESSRNFLEEYESIAQSAQTYNSPDLVLVGGGFLGKALAYRISKVHPKIILDIGAVFDEWSGIKSRQWM